MRAATAVPSATTTSREMIRVMVVDDAVVVRGLLSRWIDEEPGLEVVASLRTGREAVDQLDRANPDVVILDVEMPDLDGISALPLLLEKKRDLVVIMASTLTRRNAEVSLKALSLGAADYVPKPETNRGVSTSPEFRRDVIEKIRQLGARRKRIVDGRARGPGIASTTVPRTAEARAEHVSAHAHPPSQQVKLRPFAPAIPKVLLIGSSTGGPQALTSIIGHLTKVVDQAPVLITQHMPPTFTTILAEHLARASGRPAHEGQDGEPVLPGHIYVAPGGRHMTVARQNSNATIALNDGPLINFCKPAVDPLFSSGAKVWGPAVLALILTGMGHDGTGGAGEIIAAGGSIVVQDEATSVVWGMPGAAAHAGVCSAVLPLDQIAPKIARLFSGDRL
jgi:two-component system, chemotaxis family, protein-glutamate methylesterase/glutaminase